MKPFENICQNAYFTMHFILKILLPVIELYSRECTKQQAHLLLMYTNELNLGESHYLLFICLIESMLITERSRWVSGGFECFELIERSSNSTCSSGVCLVFMHAYLFCPDDVWCFDFKQCDHSNSFFIWNQLILHNVYFIWNRRRSWFKCSVSSVTLQTFFL